MGFQRSFTALSFTCTKSYIQLRPYYGTDNKLQGR